MQDKGYRIDRIVLFSTFTIAALYINMYIHCHQKNYLCYKTRVQCVKNIIVHTKVCFFGLSGLIRLGTHAPTLPSSSHKDGLNCPSIIHHRQWICLFLLLSSFLSTVEDD